MLERTEYLGKASVTVDEDYWDIDKAYDKLTIVEREDTNVCYISRQPVPEGISIDNRVYWAKFGKNTPMDIAQDFGNSEEITISQKVITLKVQDIESRLTALENQINNI